MVKLKYAGLCAAGFVYTFKDAVAVGFGVSLDEFSKNKVTPQELSEKFKENRDFLEAFSTIPFR